MDDVSIDAVVVHSALFLKPDSVFHLAMNDRRFTDRGADALGELLRAGYVAGAKTGHKPAMRYWLTDKGRAYARQSTDWMGEHGRFEIIEKVRR